MKNPRMSVIMSVYNGQRVVREAIESILQQSVSDFEFLITDDGSTDETPAILEAYARQDARLRMISQTNAGLTASLNRMLAHATGAFIARMDADEVSHPMRFERQLARFAAGPSDLLVVGCWFDVRDADNVLRYERRVPDNPAVLERLLRRGINCYAHGSVMIRRSVFAEQGLAYRFRYGQDFDLWLRLSERGTLGMVTEVLHQRKHLDEGMSSEIFPRRAALNRLIRTLAYERREYGRELLNWQTEEERIFRNVPLWTPHEIQTRNTFLEARRLLCAGQNRPARELLNSIRADLPQIPGWRAPYCLSWLPGALTAPLLRLRDQITDRQYFITTIQR